ncbi:MAG: hypothetical protein M3R44_03655 [Candidatus Eremiobacteraeota bacterium]|nr:hypothetical protein [Candidatus Eremiobacteraeota bacterium]
MPLEQDIQRIEAARSALGPHARLAVDAMNAYDAADSLKAAAQLAHYGLWWFEDVCDSLDFETQSAVARVYEGSVAAGEALFSAAEARSTTGRSIERALFRRHCVAPRSNGAVILRSSLLAATEQQIRALSNP